MPRIPVPQEWFSDDGVQPEDLPEATLNEFLFSPVKPRQPEEEPELTHEQRHDAGFRGEAYQGEQLGGFQDPGTEQPLRQAEEDPRAHHKPLYALERREEAITGSEVCVFTGWPRRHVTVGKHCPHGMLETLERLNGEQRQGDSASGEGTQAPGS